MPYRTPTTRRVCLERLESRLVMSSNPFTSSTFFPSAVKSLMQVYGVPEISIAADQGGQVYTFTQINDQFYTDNLLPVPAASSLTPDSLFRVESITKTFTSVSIMTLVQDHYLNLTDSALADLGYSPSAPIKGFDPVSGKPVSIYLPSALFRITVADLMDMTSGLPLDIPINSQSFTGSAGVQDLEGSYAALAFAGPPPYAAPATALEQINYFLYETSSEYYQTPSTLTAPGTSYVYNDVNYTILGQLAQQIVQSKLDLSYPAFLQDDVLAPLGIVMPPPDNQPATNAAMVGFGGTRQGAQYPTEVQYYSYPDEAPSPSIYPDPTKTTGPFYPTNSVGQAAVVSEPYGGAVALEDHWGNGGLAATPSALVQYFYDLGQVYSTGAQVNSPLSASSLDEMVAEPTLPGNPNEFPSGDTSSSWYGLGWDVDTASSSRDTVWSKNGALPGSSSLVELEENGTAWAATVNIDVATDLAASGTSGTSGFFTELRYLINEAVDGTATSFSAPYSFNFVQPPGDVVDGQDMAPAVAVEVKDAHGNIVSSDNTSQMTLTILNGAGTSVGSVTATVTNGIAAFSDISISTIGTGYTLSASDSTYGSTNAVSAAFNVIGPAAGLVFTRQPANVAAGQILSPGVRVEVEDASSNLVTTDSSAVTVQLTSPPGNDTLIGNLTVPVVGGIANFTSLAIRLPGTYTLTVSDPIDGIGATQSTMFTVTADHLVFVGQPTNVHVGSKISPAVTVEIMNASGSVVTTDDSKVTVALATPTGSTALSGTLTVAAVKGVATFSNLSITQPGDGYSLTASDATDGLSQAVSDSEVFNVTGPAAGLVFLQQPSGVGAGQVIKPAVTVEVVDANGNVVTSDSSQVTVQLTSPPSGATLGGALKATASRGIATFSNLVVNQAGSFTLTAADSTDHLSDVVSTQFNVSADRLVFLREPTTVLAGHSMASVQVEIVGSNGAVVTSDSSSVTLQLASEPGSGVLSGTLSEAAVKGIATFTNLSINQSGNGYTLSAGDATDGVSAVISTAFDVTAADHLIFVLQPISVYTGQVMPEVTVEIVNALGHVVTTDSSQVTVQIASQSGTGILVGALTVTAVKGVATFSDLSVDEPGVGYVLAASDADDMTADVLSKPFEVS